MQSTNNISIGSVGANVLSLDNESSTWPRAETIKLIALGAIAAIAAVGAILTCASLLGAPLLVAIPTTAKVIALIFSSAIGGGSLSVFALKLKRALWGSVHTSERERALQESNAANRVLFGQERQQLQQQHEEDALQISELRGAVDLAQLRVNRGDTAVAELEEQTRSQRSQMANLEETNTCAVTTIEGLEVSIVDMRGVHDKNLRDVKASAEDRVQDGLEAAEKAEGDALKAKKQYAKAALALKSAYEELRATREVADDAKTSLEVADLLKGGDEALSKVEELKNIAQAEIISIRELKFEASDSDSII